MSDTHFEFHRDKGVSFIQSLDATDIDVLVLAGDICMSDQLGIILPLFCGKYPHVIFVPGNHDYYRTSFKRVHQDLYSYEEILGNLHVLIHDAITIDGQRFLGTPLWFRYNTRTDLYEQHMTDFYIIEDFKELVYEENGKAIDFLTSNINSDDVVISHHLPSHQSVSAKYKMSPINMYFVCDMEYLIAETKPSLWVHGHGHEPVDYKLFDTRVVSNPLGYPNEFKTPLFNQRKIITV